MVDGDWKTGGFLTDPATGEALIPVDEQHNHVLTVFPAIPGEVNSNTTSGLPATGFAINTAIPAGSAREEAAWTLVKTPEEVASSVQAAFEAWYAQQ